jgi:hypothetical protein
MACSGTALCFIGKKEAGLPYFENVAFHGMLAAVQMRICHLLFSCLEVTVNKTTVLRVVLYGLEKECLTIKQEHALGIC